MDPSQVFFQKNMDLLSKWLPPLKLKCNGMIADFLGGTDPKEESPRLLRPLYTSITVAMHDHPAFMSSCTLNLPPCIFPHSPCGLAPPTHPTAHPPVVRQALTEVPAAAM